MITWVHIDDDGQKVITCHNSHGHVVATITEEGDFWVFDLGVGSVPGGLRISKTDIGDPSEWVGSYIGMDIAEYFTEGEIDKPFLTFVDDESKAVWQVWEVSENGS